MDDAADTIVPVYDIKAEYDIDDEYRPEPAAELQTPHWLDGSVRIGIHTSIAGDIAGALVSAQKLGCNALQIFSGSPRMWPSSTSGISDADAERFRARRAELALGPLVIHANYLINLASSDPMMRVRSMQAFRGEILRALALGADFLVVHPGSAGGVKPADAIALAAESLRQSARGIHFESGRALQKQSGGLRILLENTSGRGSAIGTRFEDLRAVLDGAPGVPLGICLDTAHAFEAGYEIHTERGLERTIAELDSVVGLRHLYVVHANDSKTAFGSRVDRHQHIGQGAIGAEGFRRILTHPRLCAHVGSGLLGRVFILETPIDVPGDDRRNVRTLWELAGYDVEHAPAAEDGFSMLRAPHVAAKTASSATRTAKRGAVRSGKPKTSKRKTKTKR